LVSRLHLISLVNMFDSGGLASRLSEAREFGL